MTGLSASRRVEDVISDLKASADRALARGDPKSAASLFQRGVSIAEGRADLWIGLAASRRALGDPAGSLDAVQGALAAEPRFIPALLMKGSLLEAMGREKEAAAAYGIALGLAPPDAEMGDAAGKAMAHARQVHDRYTADMATRLRAGAGRMEAAATAVETGRLETFIDAVAGRRKIYHQEPVRYHYPGLPAIEFHDRAEFPWLEALESRTDAIRREVLSVWGGEGPEITPYINFPPGAPVDQWVDLNRSLNWSAFHLLLDGEPVEDNAARCPETMAALALIDQPRIRGRSPSAMFSILKAHTRIPPHTGVANTRLVLHLPLVVPEGCRFRVGGETRAWREGEAWVFDDTIEHEAWNDSDQPRAILICDVWSPRLSAAEREGVTRVIDALDRFTGAVPPGDGL
jgi:aspartyl/asparaginyl beta-hydroxylase (cupin superfamily)